MGWVPHSSPGLLPLRATFEEWGQITGCLLVQTGVSTNKAKLTVGLPWCTAACHSFVPCLGCKAVSRGSRGVVEAPLMFTLMVAIMRHLGGISPLHICQAPRYSGTGDPGTQHLYPFLGLGVAGSIWSMATAVLFGCSRVLHLFPGCSKVLFLV